MELHDNGMPEDLNVRRADVIKRVRDGENMANIARLHGLKPVHVHNIWQAELRRVAENDVKQEIRADVRKQQKQTEPELTNMRKLLLRANAFYESGETARQVCARLGLNYNTFHAWRYEERKQGRLPESKGRPIKRRHVTKTPKAAKVREQPYSIKMPPRQGECRTCAMLKNELHRVISENLDLRIETFRQF